MDPTERCVDARGLACPEPVVRTRRAMSEAGVETVRVLLNDEVSMENVQRMASTLGWQTAPTREGDVIELRIRRPDGIAAQPQPAFEAAPAVRSPQAAVLVGSSVLGVGDEELGRVLMRVFIKTLRELSPRPSPVIFFNSGVRLTTKGSPLIDDLRALAADGVTILSCGTCLDYYHLSEALEVGAVSNMYEIVTALAAADRVIQP